MSIRKTAKDLIHTRRALKGLGLSVDHEVKTATLKQLDADILKAQRLHTKTYLKLGYISEDEIEDKIISVKADPHQLHSVYFFIKNTKNGEVVATARQIFYETSKNNLSFPLLERGKLYTQSTQFLEGINLKKCVEISGLAKASGTPSSLILLLYREMWHYSLKNKHKLWVMACDPRLYKRLRLLFGPAIQQIGERTPYKGADIIPAMLEPGPALREFMRISRSKSLLFGISRRELIGFFLSGLSAELIPAKDKHIYKKGHK